MKAKNIIDFRVDVDPCAENVLSYGMGAENGIILMYCSKYLICK